ncbi:NucA/NucB deoxyribonuclease domain-containing protein [Amycolatopsis sacchari]|uniref:NucA/NucB deoxyribonuclease domain-containing protein n=1 Tax=Amycolatopsis sacchari TaxID=115433 RepID=UPI003D756A01
MTLLAVAQVVTGGPASASTPTSALSPIVESQMTVGQQQEQCAQRAALTRSSGNYSCTTHVKANNPNLPAKRAATRPDSLRALDSGDFSSQAVAPACSEGYYNPNRFTSCSEQSWIVTNTQTVNGATAVVGEMTILFNSSVEFAEGSDPSGWDLDTDLTVTSAWGTLASGITGTMWTGCYGHPDKCTTSQLQDSNGENEAIVLGNGTHISKWYTQYPDTLLYNEVLSLNGNLGSAIRLNTPGNAVTLADHQANTLFGRCDNLPNRYGAGCVDDQGLSYVLYDTRDNPAVGHVAQHVFDAIRNLPSHWGSPYGSVLNRITDQAAIDNNRAISCGSVVTGPGESCDEYPLASTKQGGNGAAPGDRSTRVVPQSANDSQGGLTGAYYDYYRILDNNEFYVQAVLADGTSAW